MLFTAIILCLASGPATAVPGPAAPPVSSGLGAADLFVIAEQLRSESRSADAEAIYDALSRDPDVEVRTEALFRKGLMLASEKRYRDAALAFRAVLDARPDAARARLELARVLALMGDERAARREVRQSQASGLPDDVAIVADQFALALRSQKRVGGSVELALAPDSNINRATDARTLDTVIAPLTLSEEARAQSGLGVKLAGQGYARIDMRDDLSLVPRLSGRGNFYRTSAFNDVAGSALLGLEWQGKREKLNVSAGQTWRWYGGDLYARTRTVSVDWLHPLDRRAQLDTGLSIARVRYVPNPVQDGYLYDLNTSYEQALSARSGGRVTLSVTRQTAGDPGYATWSGGASALAWREIGRSTYFASAGVKRLEGDARLILFRERRQEWFYQVGAGATLRRFTVSGFAPILRIAFERNASSVGIYGYRRIALEAGLTRAF